MNRGQCIDKFFTNYPLPSVYENDAEMKERLGAMREAVSDLRLLAIEAHSVKDLLEVQTLEQDLAMFFQMTEMRRRARGVLIPNGSV